MLNFQLRRNHQAWMMEETGSHREMMEMEVEEEAVVATGLVASSSLVFSLSWVY